MNQKTNRLASRVDPPKLNQADLKIEEWRAARNAALQFYLPVRRQLIDLYVESLIDNHLASLVKTRRLKAIGSPFVVLDDKNQIHPELLPLLQRPWMQDFLTFLIDTRFWGFSLIELGQFEVITDQPFKELSSVHLIPRRQVEPIRGLVFRTFYDQSGIEFRDDKLAKYLIEVGDPFDLGELEAAVPEVITKRYGRGDWARRSEKVGIPIVKMATDETDEKELDKKENMLRNFGANTYILYDKDSDQVDFLEPKEGANGHLIFKELAEMCNAELSKLILGQTMTADNGSSKSQAEVHERVLNEYTEADLRWMQNIINFQLFPKLVDNGYPLKGYKLVFNQFLKETISPGVSALQNTEATPVEKPSSKQLQNRSITGFTKPSGTGYPEGKFSSQAFLAAHINEMRSLVSCCHDKDNKPASSLKVFNGDSKSPVCHEGTSGDFGDLKASLLDDFVKLITDFGTSLHQLLSEKAPLTDKKYQPYLTALSYITGKHLSEGFNTTFSKAREKSSSPFSFKDEAFIMKARQSLFTFSGAKSVSQLITMRDAIFDGEKVVPFTQFREKSLAINKEWNQTWMQTEYDSVIQSANMASKWVDIDRDKDLYPYLQYKTVGDNLVRPEHQALSGIIKKVDDPFWSSYYPPLGWNCRCSVTQLSKSEVAKETPDGDKLDQAIKKAKVEPYFKGNVGQTARIFSKEHKYFKTLCAEFSPNQNCDEQVNLKLAGSVDAIALQKYLVEDLGYRHIEGDQPDDNGAYLVYPKDWSKSDLDSAKRCWPAMKKEGLQFIGINPADKTIAHPDGLMNGMTTELKNIRSGSNVQRQLSQCLTSAVKKDSHAVVIVIDDNQNHQWLIKKAIGRITELKGLGKVRLSQIVLITPNEKSTISL